MGFVPPAEMLILLEVEDTFNVPDTAIASGVDSVPIVPPKVIVRDARLTAACDRPCVNVLTCNIDCHVVTC